MKIVVIGGTGLIGSKLVAKLAGHGHQAVPASPDTGVDTLTGEGGTDTVDGDRRGRTPAGTAFDPLARPDRPEGSGQRLGRNANLSGNASTSYRTTSRAVCPGGRRVGPEAARNRGGGLR